MFDGINFSYWKIWMEAYLDAIDSGVLKAAESVFPAIKDSTAPTPDQANYYKWNAKARNILLWSLNKESFNKVRSEKKAHNIWTILVEIHMGSKDEREGRFKVVMDKLMLSKCFLMKVLTKCILI